MTAKKLTIIQVSESDFSVKGQGVHTAYEEIASGLTARDDTHVVKNKFSVTADIRHIHTVGPYSAMHLLFGSGKKVVSVHVIPASFVGSLVGAHFWLPLAALYLRWFYGRADMLFAVSGTVAHELKTTLKLGKKRIETFYNTVNMQHYASTPDERVAARKKLGIAEDATLVLGNGQVQPRKRLDTFYETAELLPDVQFIWIGGIPFKRLGADYAEMTHLMEHPPKNARVTGVIDHELVRTYLAAADAFFLPAEQENHPMCVLEAAGASLPILLRDMPEYDDTFRGDAYMVKDAKMAADEIARLRRDSAYRKERVAQTKRIAERFDSSAGAARAVQLYKTLL